MSYDIVKPFKNAKSEAIYFETVVTHGKPRIFKLVHSEGKTAIFYECNVVRKGDVFVPSVDSFKSLAQFDGKRTGMLTYLIHDPYTHQFLNVQLYVEKEDKFPEWKVGTILYGEAKNGETVYNHFFKIIRRNGGEVTIVPLDTRKAGYTMTPTTNPKSNAQTTLKIMHDQKDKGKALLDHIWLKVWDGKPKAWYKPSEKNDE